MSKLKSILHPLSSILILALLTGCAATKEERQAQRAVDDYMYGNYARAASKLKPLADKTDENYVLNNARLGSTTLADYDLDDAESAFLNAYEVINATGVNSGGRGAAAAIISEKMKVWKGEPFEKAMVNYYLGIVYYMRHDYENARAAFENSLFKLRDYGESKNKSDEYRKIETDFALGYLMLAKAQQRLGEEDAARKSFDRVIELRPQLKSVANERRNAESNVLLIVDFGFGPRRVTSEYDGAFVGFAPRPQDVGPVPLPHVTVDGKPVTGPRTANYDLPPVDLLALAQDKRWQDIDTIRATKDIIGTGLIAGGAYEGIHAARHERHQGQNAAIAAGLIATGVLLKASSQADTRTWEMLPRTSFVIPLTLPPGKHDITVDFPEARSQYPTWRNLEVPEKGEATYYFRMGNYNQGPYTWPPPTIAPKSTSTPPPSQPEVGSVTP
jgi:tetratricopeptide (TPR) repeat protein